MKKFSRKNALDLLVWYEMEGKSNWGTWGNYPALPVGARYLEYETNKCQINLDSEIEIDGDIYNCITASRAIGDRWDKPISFFSLKSAFDISTEEISAEIEAIEMAKKLSYLKNHLEVQKRLLKKDDYAPFIPRIERVFLKSERPANESFTAVLPAIKIGHAELSFSDAVEWKFIRRQGRNGSSKKNVFAPVEIPSHILTEMNLVLSEQKELRVAYLKNEVESLKKRIAELQKKED